MISCPDVGRALRARAVTYLGLAGHGLNCADGGTVVAEPMAGGNALEVDAVGMVATVTAIAEYENIFIVIALTDRARLIFGIVEELIEDGRIEFGLLEFVLDNIRVDDGP